MLFALLAGCFWEVAEPPPQTEIDSGGASLPELLVQIDDWFESCDDGLLELDLIVSNVGDVAVSEGVLVQVYDLESGSLLASTTTPAELEGGQMGQPFTLTVSIDDIGADGLQVMVDGDDQVEEHDLWPNTVDWDHVCCEPEESTVELGELWGVANAWNGDIGDLFLEEYADLGDRPGSAIWRLDLDTGVAQVIRVFDPLDGENIWYLGTLALDPDQPLAYVSGYRYHDDPSSSGYEEEEWLDGADTLLVIETVPPYDLVAAYDLAPEAFSFTGLASDFVDGQDGYYSPGGLAWVNGGLHAVEGMTVEHADLIHLDLTSSGVTSTALPTALFADTYWGGGLETADSGQVYGVCQEQPEPNGTPGLDELAYVPEPHRWIEIDLDAPNDCDDPLFTFELDRVHGVALGGDDTLYAGRSARNHWYDEAALQTTDLQLYTVHDDGTMHPFTDLAPLFSTLAAPIDGIGGMDWAP